MLILHCPNCDSDLREAHDKKDMISHEIIKVMYCLSNLCDVQSVAIVFA